MNQNNPNNLAPVVEQIIVEENQIQDILNRFKQPIPEGFAQIETDYICTTKAKWNKPLCERYGFTHQGKWIQIDIPHSLLDKLELEKGKEITDNFYLNPNVLTHSETYGAITIANETEIFLDKPLTINSLEKSLTEWVVKINHLEEQIKELEENTEKNQATISNLQEEINCLKDQKEELTNKLIILQNEIVSLKDWKSKVKFELVPFFWPNSFYTEDSPEADILVEKFKELVLEFQEKEKQLAILKIEHQESQKKSEEIKLLNQKNEELENKLEISIKKNEELRNKLSELESEKNEQVIELEKKLEKEILEKEKQLEKTNKLQSKLDKEKDWWDKWINDDDIQSYAHDLRNFLSKKFNKEFFSFDLKFKSEKIVTDWMDIKNGYFAHTSFNCEKKSREVIKLIAEYYKEKI